MLRHLPSRDRGFSWRIFSVGEGFLSAAKQRTTTHPCGSLCCGSASIMKLLSVASSCQVAQPAKLLIVAFAASQAPPAADSKELERDNSTRQGEPEWLGFLRRLLEKGKACMDCAPALADVMMCCWQVTPLPQASADLSDLLEAKKSRPL